MTIELTTEQEQTVEQAMQKFIPVYENAMGRKIMESEKDVVYFAYIGCFRPGRGGKEELDSILKSNITHWNTHRDSI